MNAQSDRRISQHLTPCIIVVIIPYRNDYVTWYSSTNYYMRISMVWHLIGLVSFCSTIPTIVDWIGRVQNFTPILIYWENNFVQCVFHLSNKQSKWIWYFPFLSSSPFSLSEFRVVFWDREQKHISLSLTNGYVTVAMASNPFRLGRPRISNERGKKRILLHLFGYTTINKPAAVERELNWWTGLDWVFQSEWQKMKMKQKQKPKQIICFSHLYLFPVTCTGTTKLDTTSMLYITQFRDEHRITTTIKWTNEMYRI